MKRGFTLVEVLVTFTILAFLVVLIYSVVNSTVRAHDAIDEVLRETEPPPAILNILRQDIESAFVPDADLPYFKGGEGNSPHGEADELDLVSTQVSFGAADGDGEPAFHAINEVGYRLKPHPTLRDFMILYRREEHFIDEKPNHGGTLIELYDRVKTMSIHYWDGKDWLNDWDSQQREGKLPLAVKVQITLAATRDVTSHVLIVPLVR